ncbi:hypothetical protein REPUB_Repub20aG0055300 [Reevesia pubescens]
MEKQSNSEEFPDDIVMEILLRLPVKSLCRFKCVCKFWCNGLISDSQYFVKLQLNQSIKANRLTYALYARSHFPRRLELDYESLVSRSHNANPTENDSLCGLKIRVRDKIIDLTGRQMRVWGSCNGLLCFVAVPKILVLANVSTRETKTIFYCDDTKSRIRVTVEDEGRLRGGFGYDASKDDYKVVKIHSSSQTVDVYSLKKDHWSFCGNFPKEIATIRGRGDAGVHLNGTIHWLARPEINIEGSKQKHAWIIAFDLTKEEFFDIPTPIVLNDIVWYELFTDGRCLYIVRNPSVEQVCEIWVMGESWKRIHLSFSYHKKLIPLNFPKTEEALFLIDGRLFLYNRRTERQKEVTMGNIPRGYAGYMLNGAFSYVESLVSLGCSTKKRSPNSPNIRESYWKAGGSKRTKN